MAICEKCGKEFEAKGDWQKVCIDCYKASAGKAKEKATAKATTSKSTSSSTSKKEMVASEFRKAYDELVAEFSDVIEDVKPLLGGWTTSIVLSRTK